MNAYQRPLFRQAGGPVGLESLPPPPPAGVAAIPQQDPQAMVEAAGQTASSEMESVGQGYVLEMMDSLDSAGNFKTVIDALRGNKLPMRERFAELAEYVGEDDAEKTPESVLAMVQPVIMMTEEGNVDSGIGQLMQGLTGEVDMMTDEGDLTDMGQGVGSLMVANQPAPPPQQFANGGAVQHFQMGGPPIVWDPSQGPTPDPALWPRTTLPDSPRGTYVPGEYTGDYQGIMSIYSPEFRTRELAAGRGSGVDLFTDVKETLPMYQELFSDLLDPESRRDRTRSTALFNVAKAGLNFAAGVDPTGKSVTNQPIISQLAAAAGELPEQMSALAEREYGEEQALRTAALQQTISQVGAERSLEAQLLSKEEISRLNARVQALLSRGSMDDLRRAMSDPATVEAWGRGEALPYFDMALSVVYKPFVNPSTGLLEYPEVPQYLVDKALERRDAGFELPAVISRLLEAPAGAGGGAVQKLQAGGPVQNFQTGMGPLTNDALAGITDADSVTFEELIGAGLRPPSNRTGPDFGTPYDPTAWAGVPDDWAVSRRSGAPADEAAFQLRRRRQPIPDQPTEPLIMSERQGVDISEATGFWNLPKALANTTVDAVSEAFGLGSENAPAPIYRDAISALNTWNSELDLTLKNSLIDRDNTTAQANIDSLKIPTGLWATTWKGDAAALLRLEDTRRLLRGELIDNQNVLNSPSTVRTERSQGEQVVDRIERLLVDLDLMIAGFTMKVRGSPAVDFDYSNWLAPTEGSQ